MSQSNYSPIRGWGKTRRRRRAENGPMTLEARRRRLASISRFAFPLAVMAFQATAADGSPLSVCDAIAKRIENNGRVVDVRGDVMAGGHGIYLASNKCAGELVARGVTWPNFINLV